MGEAPLMSETCQLKHIVFEAKVAFIEVLNRYTLADTLSKSQLIPFINLP